jgi:lipoprotein-releasing system ATP-binding protein
MNELMIEAHGITKEYGDLKVLKGIDLQIPSGKITSIVGASGAGKTTLLQILGTLDQALSRPFVINTLDSSFNFIVCFRNFPR